MFVKEREPKDERLPGNGTPTKWGFLILKASWSVNWSFYPDITQFSPKSAPPTFHCLLNSPIWHFFTISDNWMKIALLGHKGIILSVGRSVPVKRRPFHVPCMVTVANWQNGILGSSKNWSSIKSIFSLFSYSIHNQAELANFQQNLHLMVICSIEMKSSCFSHLTTTS